MLKLLNILGITLLALSFSNIVHAQEVGRSIIVLGDAWVMHGRQKTKLTPGYILQQSDIVVTGDHGRVRLSMSDGSRVFVSPKTRLSLKRYAKKKNSLIARFDMFWGRARFLVKKLTRSRSNYNIHTSTAVLGVRGTDFEINIPMPESAETMVFDSQISLSDLPSLPTSISLKTGAVIVTGSNGSQQTLAPGEQLSVDQSGNVSAPEADSSPLGEGGNEGETLEQTTAEPTETNAAANSGADNSASNFANSTAASTAASSGVTQGVTITTPYTYGTPQPANP